jgi:predicted DNA-binding transcriptional regulator AlpA
MKIEKEWGCLVGRKQLIHTKRPYKIRYRRDRYRASSARIAELPERGTARQVAFVLGVSPAVVYGWIDTGEFPVWRRGRGPWWIGSEDLVTWMRAQGFLHEDVIRGVYD